MKVLTHPILLEKQLNTIFLKKKPPRTFAGTKWWLQKVAGGAGAVLGVHLEQSSKDRMWVGFYFPFVNHLSELNEFLFFKERKKYVFLNKY